MTWKKLQRVLACLLAVLLLSQVGAFSPAVLAADGSSYTLQNGTAIIKSGMSVDEVNHALTRALVKDFDQMSEEEQNALLNSLQWEYETKAKTTTIFGTEKESSNKYWDSIAGGRVVEEGSKYTKTKYTCPALKDNKDGSYQVRVASTTAK